MDAFIFTQIINDKDYLEWRKLIDQVNEEYDDKVYYDECIMDKKATCTMLWNYRSSITSLSVQKLCK